ncbi:MAG TPA: redoxin domain-containing protein [Ohtaekwangia sp.]|nr:redoxin domain-containing protein [Ohtaekwangia sp.]
MIKKFLALLLCLSVTLVSCTSSSKKSDEDQTAVVGKNDLPAMKLTFVDGKETSAKKLDGKSILILFQPDCDHCQREAQDIAGHLDSFNNYTLYFISSAPLEQISKFSVDYGLQDRANVSFAQTTVDDVLNTFGSIPTPSIYIYSSEKQLVKAFNGEVSIAEVIKEL